MKTIAQNGERRQPKIKTEMSGKGLTVHAALLPVLAFMGKLLFRQRVQEAIRKERGQMPSIRLLMPCKWQ